MLHLTRGRYHLTARGTHSTLRPFFLSLPRGLYSRLRIPVTSAHLIPFNPNRSYSIVALMIGGYQVESLFLKDVQVNCWQVA